MIRIRLIATAFLILAVMPGCGIFHKDRPCFPRLNALFCGNTGDSTAGYPVISEGAPACDNCNGAMPISGQMMPGPIMGGVPVMPGGGMMTAPPMNANPPGGRIPPAGIKESEGKQFELEGASKIGPGPVLAVPAGGLKNR